MRICFISTGTFSHIGPYLEYFRQAGHDVYFVCLSPGPERDVPTYDTGFGKKYSQTQGKWKYPLSMLRMRKIIRSIKPDIIHAHYATSGGLASLVSGFHPAIVTVHGSDLINGIKSIVWRPLLKKIFNYADCVNVVSKELEEIALSLGISKEKIEVLTLGIDTEKFSFTKRPELAKKTVLRMICTRRMERVFDHLTILNALSILKEKGIDFEMTFAGDGSLLDEMKRQADNLGLSDKVKFIGMIPNNDLPDLLARNDIYLSASLWDGASLSLLEAMASGLFPIVSDINANSAWIQNEYNGYLHKVGDAKDLANCVLKLLVNPEIIPAAAEHNRQKVCENADRNTNMKILESVYKKLTSK
ncbi:MAG: glycosyltransferase family 4 protein [Sedimentisphaerales bacterium]|nr:glycosyltransferase family 4 protein [Sedimentisphaerales bacterium]